MQVAFDTVGFDADEDARQTPYVLISRLFEFPGRATIEWHDGCDYDGGAQIVGARLRRTGVSIWLNRPLEIEVGFQVSDGEHEELRSFLASMLGNCMRCMKESPNKRVAGPPSRVVISKDPAEFE